MKVLFVASENSGRIAQFIIDQIEIIKEHGTIVKVYGVRGHGFIGYLRNLKRLRSTIKSYQPDIVHAHYGLCGLLANMQRIVKVVTTYHGSDVNKLRNRFLSQLSILFSEMNIFVSKRLKEQVFVPNHRGTILPCGVDINLFKPIDVIKKNKYPKILFAGAFDNPIKNSSLARLACNINGGVNLVELKGIPHEEVPLLMNECAALLMTSYKEGSPQVVKEALACNLPVISVDVGDVRYLFGSVRGCIITPYSPAIIAKAIDSCIRFGRLRYGRERIIKLGLDVDSIGKKLIKVYTSIKVGKRRVCVF